jgi:hypothetical protein
VKYILGVLPNPHNPPGFNIIVYRRFLCFTWEVGRFLDREQLDNWIKAVHDIEGQEIEK